MLWKMLRKDSSHDNFSYEVGALPHVFCEMMNEIDGRPVRQDLQGATLTLASKGEMEILERLKVLERGISHPQRKKRLSEVDALEGSSPYPSWSQLLQIFLALFTDG